MQWDRIGMRAPDLTRTIQKTLRRDELFAGLFIVLCANGLAGAAAEAVYWYGWAEALMTTFYVSVIVIVACCVAPVLALRESNNDAITGADLVVAAAAVCLA